MAVLGTAIGYGIFGKDAFGRKPNVPDLPKIDPSQVQQQTVAGNQSALPSLQKLGSGVNTFNLNETMSMFRKAADFLSPGSFEKVQNIIGGQLRGEVNQDVQDQITRMGAARGFASGTAGSGFSRFATLRDLGLTSYQTQQQGMANLQSLMPKAPQFDITSMFFSPQQRLQFEYQQNLDQFNRNFMQSKIDAAPDPTAAAFTQAFIEDERQIMELVGSVAGMAGKAAGACWVARAVYGEDDPRWRMFRIWLFSAAPKWLAKLYLKIGPTVARAAEKGCVLRRGLRCLMDRAVNQIALYYAA
jgi:hypothetical protein